MSTLIEAMEAATLAMALDPRSASTAESVALTVQAVDEFLASPPVLALGQLGSEARAPIVHAIADQVRPLMRGLRNMLSVAAQAEAHGAPASWAPPLADAIERLEAVFHDIPDLPRTSPPPLVSPDDGSPENWRVKEEPEPQALNDIIEDALDLMKARHAEFVARSRGETPRRWESVRSDLDDA